MNNEQLLANLILENPSLEVIPLIGQSFVDYLNIDTDYTISKIGISFKSKYCWFQFHNEENLIIEGNIVIIEDYLYKKCTLKNKFEKLAFVQQELNKINWNTAIFVYINQR